MQGLPRLLIFLQCWWWETNIFLKVGLNPILPSPYTYTDINTLKYPDLNDVSMSHCLFWGYWWWFPRVIYQYFKRLKPEGGIISHERFTLKPGSPSITGCVHYFLSNLYFSPNDSPSRTMNIMFSISSKKLFLFFRYLIFCIFVFPSFFPVSHCFWGLSKKNLKIYVINCLSKNLITYFVWYLERGLTLKLCPLIEN